MSRVLLLAAILSSVAQAATFTVDTTSNASLTACTANAGDCSFSGAIAAANATAAQDTIAFAIPLGDPGCDAGSGVCTITPTPGSSRDITQPLVIDGYTQPGAVPNSNSPTQGGLNGALKIQLDGNNGGNAGLNLSSSTPSVVRGLVINRFNSRAAIQLQSTAAHRIEGNYIGTDPSGTLARPNNEFGILVNGQGGAYVIGGLTPDTRNLISGNQVDGLHFQTGFQGGPSDGMRIQGNLIGTTVSGLAPLVNGTVAVGGRSIVLVTGSGGAQNILVGGSDPNARNVLVGVSSDTAMYIEQYTASGPGFLGSRIEGNLLGLDVAGTTILGNSRVFVRSEVRGLTIGGTTPGTGNVFAGGSLGVDLAGQAQVLGNSIYSHTGLGLSIASGTRVPNDANDADTRRQNFPEISAYTLGGGNASINYRVDSDVANSAYPLRVEFYQADGDEGRHFIGADSYLAAEAQSIKPITLPIPSGLALSSDDVIVATATDANGNTSEFSFALIQSLSILSDSPDPLPAGTGYLVSVRAESAGTPFKPNGTVQISDDRGGSCVATLVATATANRSEGGCELSTTGAAGTVTLTANYSTFASAFATADGASIAAATASHQIIPGVTAVDGVAGNHQYASVGGAFAEALRVRVVGEGGAPFAGATVQFSAPVAGATANLSVASAVSDADGFAQVLATANGVAGRYAVTARIGAFTQLFILNNDSALGSRCTGARSSTLGFRDDFVGAAIDPARWTVDVNDGTVSVAAGEATVNAGNVVGFPYVTANGAPLPASGAFSLRWIATYTSTSAVYGNNSLVASTGLAPDGGPVGDLIFHAFAGQYPSGYVADARISTSDAGPAAFISNPPALLRREIEFCWLDGRNELWVDGVRVENPLRDPTLLRPDALWFGNFDRGVLPGEHPDFRLDLVEVRALEVGFDTHLQIVSTTPNPSTPGQSVLLSVALNPEPGAPVAPSGAIAVNASTGENCTIVLPASSCSLSFATLGPRAISAVYSGDELYRAGKAAVAAHQVLPPPSLHIADVEATEGNTGATAFVFTVTLDNPSGASVSVDFATAADSASAPGDFSAASGTLQFSGATTTQAVTVQVSGDTEIESDERFFVNLSNASGATIADAQASGSIVNDDQPPPPSVRISDASAQEQRSAEVNTAAFTVTLNRLPEAEVSVRVRTVAGSASTAVDFDELDFVISFAPDGPIAQTIEVPILADDLTEPSESFSVELSEPAGLSLADASGSGLIIDADASAVVNSTADSNDGQCLPAPGGCTLREAILQANAGDFQTRIRFAIPGSTVQIIRPLSPLPALTAPQVIIDGFTQPGSSAGSFNTPIVPTVEIDGALAGPADGLKLCGVATVRGLAIHSFSGAGVRVGCGGSQRNAPVAIRANHIGTDASGEVARGNGSGIVAELRRADPDAFIDLDIGMSSSDLGNVIVASTGSALGQGDGILIVQSPESTEAPVVQVNGNTIGLSASGRLSLGNRGWGVRYVHPGPDCQFPANLIDNLIAANQRGGIAVHAGALPLTGCQATTTSIYNNRIGRASGAVSSFGNGGPAVEIGQDGAPLRAAHRAWILFNEIGSPTHAAIVTRGSGTVSSADNNRYYDVAGLLLDNGGDGQTPNDPGDTDVGPNELLNTPTPLLVSYNPVDSQLTLSFDSNSPINRSMMLHALREIPGEPMRTLARRTFTATASSQTLSFPVGRSIDFGDTERVRLYVSTLDGATSEVSAGAAIADAAKLTVGDARRGENLAGSMSFTVTSEPPPTTTRQLLFRTGDASARAGLDYTASSGTVTLSAAAPVATVTVPILNDSLVENDELLRLDVADTADFAVGSARAFGVIVDDERLRRNELPNAPLRLPDLNGRNGFALELTPGTRYALTGLNDFNGDLRADLAVGVDSTTVGRVHLLTALAAPFQARYLIPATAAPGFAHLIGVTGDAFGRSLSALDLRSDGRSDLIIGAPRSSSGLGRALVLHGRNAALPNTVTAIDTLLGGPTLGEAILGSAAPSGNGFTETGGIVTDIGDVNGDGRRDLAITRRAFDNFRGGVALVFGTTGVSPLPSTIAAIAPPIGSLIVDNRPIPANQSNGRSLGSRVAGIGDFNGDGFGDIAVSDADGVVTVVTGRVSWPATVNAPDQPIRITAPNGSPDSLNPMIEVAGRGDFNGDGRSDLLIAQPGFISRNLGYIVLGRAGSAPIVLPAAGSASEVRVVAPWIEDARPLQHNSSTVAMLPDFNGDGLSDALFATPGADTGGPASGGAFVIYGRRTPAASIDLNTDGASKRFEGAIDSRAGDAVVALPDIQGDGLGDLGITAPRIGRVYVAFSNDALFSDNSEDLPPPEPADVADLELGRPPAGAVLLSMTQGVEVPSLMRPVGDLNGDGRVDADIGGNVCDPGFVNCARRIVFGRSSGGVPTTLNGANGFLLRPRDAVPVGGGDFDGDGRSDLLVTYNQRAYLYYGRSGSWPAVVDVRNTTTRTELSYDNVSVNAVSRAVFVGDINGDARSEIGLRVSLSASCCTVKLRVLRGQQARPARLSLNTATGVDFTTASGDIDIWEGAAMGNLGGSSFNDFTVGVGFGVQAVVFGASPLPNSVALDTGLNGVNGFTVTGLEAQSSEQRIHGTRGNPAALAIVWPTATGSNRPNGMVAVVRGGSGGLPATISPASFNIGLGPSFLGSALNPVTAARVTVTSADYDADGSTDLAIRQPLFESHAVDSGRVLVIPNILGQSGPIALDDIAAFEIRGERKIFKEPRLLDFASGDWNGDGRVDVFIDDVIVSGAVIDP